MGLIIALSLFGIFWWLGTPSQRDMEKLAGLKDESSSKDSLSD